MADYGAPVFPFLAVGGYKGKLGAPRGGHNGEHGQEVGVLLGFWLSGVAGLVGAWWEATDLLVLPPFPATSFIFFQGCSDSLVLCLGPQELPLGCRG